MTAINRSPTPPGPIADLYDRLDALHLTAGRPSMRDIAARAGRGQISSSTVRNVFVFRNSKVPRWSFLEEIVKALRGDTSEFMGLWQAAWQAENRIGMPAASPPDDAPPNPGRNAVPSQGRAQPAPSGSYQRIWSAEIPSRNPNFTGRVAELETLRTNLLRGRPDPPAQVISGMGGIGKTEIATEYIHLHRDKYDIVWSVSYTHLTLPTILLV